MTDSKARLFDSELGDEINATEDINNSANC